MTQTAAAAAFIPGQPVFPASKPVRYTSTIEIEREIEVIGAVAQHDPALARVLADELVREVLEVISGVHAQYTYLAVAALKVYELDIPRPA